MKILVLLLTILPGAWVGYGVVRVGLSFTDVPQMDQVALSFLTGAAWIAAAIALGFSHTRGINE